jgi:hypothetical protein
MGVESQGVQDLLRYAAYGLPPDLTSGRHQQMNSWLVEAVQPVQARGGESCE